MAIDPRQFRLVSLLEERTEHRRLDWQLRGRDEDNTFIASLATVSFVIYSKDADAAHPFVLELLNQDGAVAERIESAMAGSRTRDMPDDEVAQLRRFNGALSRTWEMARRKALGADQVVETAIAELERDF